ncbi:MAG: S1/P1 nuclease [Bacteroidetes bacterium]|nr:S1/P1 nuclease [Bacteroidota bacterium]MBS1642132.1 S1/P1 nuclease [Bacteroidota bacterium]MBS1671974.1 S1/P1 nuclease [Bacteroidota bacterium]
MKSIKKVLIISAFLYIPYVSMAWGLLGHRVVAEIASTYLTPKAKAAIKDILGNESMAMSANWADFIKSDPTYNYLSSWHYVDFKAGMSCEDVKKYLAIDTADDAYTKINFLTAELKKKNLDKDKKLMYLRLLIHIVGDIHQPMHTAHDDDQGGNKVYVLWFGQKSNLHSVWDSKLIDEQGLSYTEYANAINYTTPAQRQAWQKETVQQWICDSHELAESLYAEIKQPEQKLSYRYNFDHIAQLNQQLLKGGVHLAGLLNSIFM